MQELIKLQNCYPDTLHLYLNNGNNAFDMGRDGCQFLLTSWKEDETAPRDLLLAQNDPRTWVCSSSSAKQPAIWVQKGPDFEGKVKQVIKVPEKPITKWTGPHLTQILRRALALFDNLKGVFSLLSAGLVRVQPQLEHMWQTSFAECPLSDFAIRLQQWWESLRECDRQLMSAEPNLRALQHAIAEYKQAVSYFAHPNQIAPLQYTPKTYDHMLVHHMFDLVERMADDAAMSPGVVCSSCIESANKSFKEGLLANTSGGNPKVKSVHGNDAWVKTFRSVGASHAAMRWDFYDTQGALEP